MADRLVSHTRHEAAPPSPKAEIERDPQALTRMARLYSWILRNHPEGEPGRRYLAERGIDFRSTRFSPFRLGYCPPDGETVSRLADACLLSASRRGVERFAGYVVVSELSPDGSLVVDMTARRVASAVSAWTMTY